jgi:probable phosphoglycerate mutase
MDYILQYAEPMSHNPNTYLYLIRHGESAINTIPGTFGGRQNESPLTEKGMCQAQKLGAYLVRASIVPTQIFSSPAVRAYDTGRESLRVAGIALPIAKTPELQELDRGAWTGRTRAEIDADAALQAAMLQQGMDYKPEDGESMRDVYTRMTNWADSVIDPRYTSENPQHIVAYSHSNAIGCFAAAASGLTRHYTDSIQIGQASVSIFSNADEGWQVEAVNISTQE